jgi:adenylosuccinate lyase
MTLPLSAAQTAATQWLERTLDDSVNRRLTLPQAFLSADAVLNLALNLAGNLTVNEEIVHQHVQRELPYMLTEPILMRAVALGRDRQQVHERIRQLSHEVTARLKAGADRNDLLDLLAGDPLFRGIDFEAVQRAAYLTGRAEQQVEEFITDEIEPIRQRFTDLLNQRGEVRV